MMDSPNARASHLGAWMLYGATGYTGRLCVCEADRRWMQPILAGRNAVAVREMAETFNLEHRAFPLDHPAAVVSGLAGVRAVLNCAGPFSATARPLLDACARTGVSYLDVTGEIGVVEYIHEQDAAWKQARIAVVPGVGFDVVPSDCLAAMLHQELPDATHLQLAFKSSHMKISPGTAKTVLESLALGGQVRRNGQLETAPLGSVTAVIPFSDGPAVAVQIPWGDVVTAYYSTGIPNIEVYMGIPPRDLRRMRFARRFRPFLAWSPVQSMLKNWVTRHVEGPTSEQRALEEVRLYGEVWNRRGQRVAMAMKTPGSYNLTVDAALSAVVHVLEGSVAPGAHTPSRAFGARFVGELAGVEWRVVETA